MLSKVFKSIKPLLEVAFSPCRIFIDRLRARNKTKYFCIGRNKTGTTSLKVAFERLGYPIGVQRKAEKLYDRFYFEGNFEPIIKYCRTAQVFQDVPFSCPETFKHLDKAFPGSKFILTVRDNPEQWYKSLTKFHAQNFGKDGRVPTSEDLKNALYVRKGFMYNTVRLHGTMDTDPYNKVIMQAHYQQYNQDVIEYFKDRPNDLLIINLSDDRAYKMFTDFLGVNTPFYDFPWENRT